MRSVAAVLLAALTVACDADVPPYVQTPAGPTIQTPTRLTLTAQVGIGDTATQARVTARVLDQQDRGIPNTPVSFASSHGILAPINISTNSNGDAQTTLTSGVSSTVTVAGAGMKTSTDVTIIAPLSVSLSVGPAEKRVSVPITALVTPAPVPPVSYVWNFGDGTSAQTSSPSISHAWPEDDPYVLEVRVSDALERSGLGSARVNVRDNQEPPASPAPVPPPAPSLNLTLTCSAAATGLLASCNVAAAYGGSPIQSAQITGVSWDWGDGFTQTGNVARTHTYAGAGTYTIFVTATAPTPAGPQTLTTNTVLSVK